MWIFTRNAFISAVEFDPHFEDDDGTVRHVPGTHMMVCGRRKEHLVEFGFLEANIVDTPEADFPFRTFIAKTVFAEMLQRHAAAIDYREYKAKARERLPWGMLLSTWSTVRMYLDEREASPDDDVIVI